MAITSSDVLLKYSTASGSAGNSLSGTGAGSLGKYISTTQVTTAINDLFDDVSGAENAASTVDYRCLFVHNAHASLDMINPVVYLSAEVSGGAGVAFAIDNITQSAIGGSSAQSATIASETTTPSGVGSFSSPTTVATGLSLGSTLTHGQCRAFWIRRTAANSAALDADGVTIGIGWDTAA